MNTNEIAAEYRLSHWAEIMRQHQASGMGIKAYCKEKGFHENIYYYWRRKLREASCEQMALSETGGRNANMPVASFAEVRIVESPSQTALSTTAQSSQLRIEIGNVQMTTDSTYPPEKLVALLRELV